MSETWHLVTDEELVFSGYLARSCFSLGSNWGKAVISSSLQMGWRAVASEIVAVFRQVWGPNQRASGPTSKTCWCPGGAWTLPSPSLSPPLLLGIVVLILFLRLSLTIQIRLTLNLWTFFLPLPPKSWGCRHVSPIWTYIVCPNCFFRFPQSERILWEVERTYVSLWVWPHT